MKPEDVTLSAGRGFELVAVKMCYYFSMFITFQPQRKPAPGVANSQTPAMKVNHNGEGSRWRLFRGNTSRRVIKVESYVFIVDLLVGECQRVHSGQFAFSY